MFIEGVHDAISGLTGIPVVKKELVQVQSNIKIH